MKKQPYWISGYCKFICSECGFVTDKDYPRKEFCPSCNADMREPLKRCYYIENHDGWTYCPCGDSVRGDDGLLYCGKQTAFRKHELISWCCYYSCTDYNLKLDTGTQLTFFDDV